MTTSQAQIRSNRRQHAPGKSTRPALTTRNSHAKAHRPTSSKGKAEIPPTRDQEDIDQDDAMAHTFLQFCAVCDKQIVTPGSLYCSESCRKTDADVSPSYTLFKSDSIPPPKSASTPRTNYRDVVPQLSPTITSRQPIYPTPTSTEQSAPDPDVVSTSYRGRSHRPSASRTDSEAARYLGQFQSSDRPVSRSRYYSRSSGTNTPLLSTTPTSSASASIPYTPNYATSAHSRPPMLNPWWSNGSFSSRSVDLITPITDLAMDSSSLTTVTDKMARSSIEDRSSTPRPAANPPSSGLSYEKRKTVSGSAMSPGRSSLKQLFNFDEMRSVPTLDYSTVR